jgi:flavin-dependent dehydrogenase
MLAMRCEIVVIGGGPSGAAAAIRLAALGHHVCLLEAQVFPRRHVGEALSAGIRPQLDYLGVTEAIEQTGVLRLPGAQVRWSSDEFEYRPAQADGITVDRGRFDQVLLDAARHRGVRVLQPAAACAATRSAPGWTLQARLSGGTVAIQAGFVIDATGRAGFLPRRRVDTSPRTIALYGYWRGLRLPTVPRIEAGERQWYWGSPVPDGRFNAMVFLDPQDLRHKERPLAARYRELIERSDLLAGARSARLESRVFACDATCYADALSVGPGYIKVGETSFAIDPLSSAGVQKSIQTALAASVVAHTILLRPSSAELARTFYVNNQRDCVRQHAIWSMQSYREHRRHAHETFWHSRAHIERDDDPPQARGLRQVAWSGRDRVRLSPQVCVRDVPCLVGNFVEARSAVTAPGLRRPIAFVQGVSLPGLLQEIFPGSPTWKVGEALSRKLSSTAAAQLLDWLFQNDVLQRDCP